MRVLIPLFLVVIIIFLIALGANMFPSVMEWAVSQQRIFQNEMAAAVGSIKAGEPGGWAFLLFAAGAYGFVHAAGPGHGKYLIGGVGLAAGATAWRVVGLAVASSLTQALFAVAIVYGGFSIVTVSANQMTILAEQWLAPASYIAIGTVGMIMAIRGARALVHIARTKPAEDEHKSEDYHACGHSHGVTPDQAASVGSVREALALIASIAIRPCTGAIFLLVIAWQLDIKTAGFIAVVTMGLGTALLTSLVAVSSVAIRSLTLVSNGAGRGIGLATFTIQTISGVLILWISLIMLILRLL